MARYCKLPSGKLVNLEDLPIELLEDVTTGAGLDVKEWFVVAGAPALYPRAAVGLLRAVGKRNDEEIPDGYVTISNVLDVFPERNGDDRPTEYEDGLPKAEDDPATT